MGRRGRKRQLDVESEYWQLLKTGVGTVAACRIVGSPARPATGGGVPPVRLAETARTSRYLSLLERQRIATLHGRGHGVGEIARRISRSPSTVSRELRRNLRPHDHHVYGGDLAHARARLQRDQELREVVQAKLELEWSPQQIAAHLREAYPDRPDWHVCHETIYQALYHGGKGGLSRQLTRRLRTGRPLRKRRRRADQRRIRFVAPALLLDHRPATAEQRVRVGDWEGDLLVGRLSKSAIGTLVDPTSRYLKLVHLPAWHSAEQLWLALTEVMRRSPQQARLTLTWDQGSEMAATTGSPSTSPRACTSPIRPVRGSAAPTRTPTGCCAGTSPSAPISASIPWPTQLKKQHRQEVQELRAALRTSSRREPRTPPRAHPARLDRTVFIGAHLTPDGPTAIRSSYRRARAPGLRNRHQVSAWIHRSISELDGVSAGQQATWDGIVLHLMGAGLKGRERAFDQRYRVISYVGFGGSRFRTEQVDPPVVAAKGPSGELELALSQVREAVLLADLVGRTVRDRGKGVDLPELPLRPRLLQDLPHCLAGNTPVLELGQDHPPDLIERLILMRRLKNVDHASGGGCTVRDDLQRPAPSLGGQSQRLRMRPLDVLPRPGAEWLAAA
jgi:transposase, IS30 family